MKCSAACLESEPCYIADKADLCEVRFWGGQWGLVRLLLFKDMGFQYFSAEFEGLHSRRDWYFQQVRWFLVWLVVFQGCAVGEWLSLLSCHAAWTATASF